ncbi:MAG: transposase [Blastocatellia bacterium]
MTYDPAIHHRRSIRLRGYDYSQPGAYFVTLCTQKRKRLFGKIVNGEMRLNETGRLVANHWEWLAEKYCRVLLDEYVVMPNHLHGIIVITDRTIDVMQRASEKPAFLEKRKPIGRLIGAFKTLSTSQINQSLATSGNQLWQRDFWEHIIRNEHELNLIRAYIRNNPAQWFNDSLKVKPEVAASSEIKRSSGGTLNWNCH